MAIAKGFGCLRRTGLDAERVRVRQRHCKAVRLAHDPTNLAKRLNLDGQSMRKTRTKTVDETPAN